MALDIYGYINIGCSVVGFAFFMVCLSIVGKILNLFPNAKMTRDWKMIRFLIALFSVGYIVNIVAIILELTGALLIMQAVVYIFGALFVFIVVRLSFRTYKIIKESANADNN